MSKTSSAVKRRWNKQNYDTYTVSLPKGMKAELKAACAKLDISMNSVFVDAAQRLIAGTEGKMKYKFEEMTAEEISEAMNRALDEMEEEEEEETDDPE